MEVAVVKKISRKVYKNICAYIENVRGVEFLMIVKAFRESPGDINNL